MEADIKKLFNYICGSGGSVTFKRLREHPSPLAKLNVAETRRKLESIAENHKCFVLEKKDGQLLSVKTFFKIRLCIKYANKNCEAGKSCKYWHICKGYMEETCNKPNCVFSHNFKDEQNIGKIQDLGLDFLQSNAIRNIFSKCLPRFCVDYNTSNSCSLGDDCSNMHLCSKFVQNACLESNCRLQHNFKSEPNASILRRANLPVTMPDKIIFYHILVPKKLKLKQDETNSIKQAKGMNKKTQKTHEMFNCDSSELNNLNEEIQTSKGRSTSRIFVANTFEEEEPESYPQRGVQRNQEKHFQHFSNSSLCKIPPDSKLLVNKQSSLPSTDSELCQMVPVAKQSSNAELLLLKTSKKEEIKRSNLKAKTSNCEEVKQVKKPHRDVSRAFSDISSFMMLVQNDDSSPAPQSLKHEGKQGRQNEPVEKDVFSSLVTEYQSVTKFSTITSREDLFPSDFIDKESWFRKRCNTFILSENKKGEIEEVRAFSRKVRLCFNSAHCQRDDCKFFHLCRSHISGHCASGGTCNTNHDVTDPRDLRNLNRFNLEHLTNDQFLHLLRESTPHICFDYNKTGRCPKEDRCIKLHICQKFVRKSCNQDRKCSRDHDVALSSKHTQKVLMQYGLHDVGSNVILKTLLIVRETQETSREEHQSKEHIHMDLKERSICMDFILNKCGKGSSCDMHHCRYPYVWQHQDPILLSWTSFYAKDSETLEKSFCDPSVETVTHSLYLNLPCRPENSKVEIVNVNFKDMSFTIPIQELNATLEIKLRRLSTRSQLLNPDVTVGTKWVWFWYNGSSFVEYGNGDDDKIQNEIESFFLSNAEYYPFKKNEHNYNLYFSGMYQINLNPVYSTRRMVRRRPVFRELGKISQRIEKSRTDTRGDKQSNLPSEWVHMAPGKEFVRFKLPPTNKEYLKIEKLFRKTVPENKAVIVAIERVQNPFMWEKYMRKKKQMQQRAGVSSVDERMLFHGTSPEIVDNICKENFDWRLHGKTNGAVYGQGSYFARDAEYSYNYSGNTHTSRFMFVAKVLVGSFTEGKREMRKPPSKSSTDSSNLFDSCVNDVNNPKIFVVFDIDQYYPSHVIEFTATKTAHANPTATSSTSGASYLSGYAIPSHNTQMRSRVSGSTQVKVGQPTPSYGSRSNASSTMSAASQFIQQQRQKQQSTLGSPGVSGYNQSQGGFSYPSSSNSTGYGRSTSPSTSPSYGYGRSTSPSTSPSTSTGYGRSTSPSTTTSARLTWETSGSFSDFYYVSADNRNTSYPRTSSTNRSSENTKGSGCSVM